MDAPLLVTLGELRLGPAEGSLLAHRRKELVLLAYLARRGTTVGRDELAALLWGERVEARARQSLRQALATVRRALPDALDGDGEDGVRLRPGALRLDATLFEADVAAGRHADAVGRWGGDFLARAEDAGGPALQLWLEGERAALRRRCAVALAQLVGDTESAGDHAAAARWARRWAELAPADETVHLRLLRALTHAGASADALAEHAAFAARLRAEGGAEPSAALRRAAAELEEGARRAVVRRPGSAALLTPDLVERERALAALEEPWARLPAPAGVVLVEGEPGVGKTRLCAEFARRVRRGPRPAAVLEVRAGGPEAAGRWGALRLLLAELGRVPATADAPSRAVAELAAVAPALLARFPGVARPEPVAEPTPDAVAAALLPVLRAVAARAPLLVVLDDAAGADAETLAVLDLVLRALPEGVVVVLAGRGDEQGWPALRDRLALLPGARRLRLSPLGVAGIDALLASMLEMPAPERLALARRLAAESGGVPYHVVELVYALADAALLALGADGVWRPVDDPARLALPTPEGARGAIVERLRRLSPAARLALDACARGGGSADARELAEATRLERDALAGALDELVTRRLLRLAAAGRYECAHELLRRTVCELPPPTPLVAPPVAPAGDPPSTRDVGGGRRAWRRLAAGLLAVGVVAVAGDLQLRRDASSAAAFAAAAPRRVVVTPLANETADPELDRLGRIAGDWLGQGLGRTGLVTVVPPVLVRDDSAAPAGRAGGLASSVTAGRRARADLAVGGYLYRTADSVWLQVSVVDVAAGTLVTTVGPVGAAASAPMAGVERLRQAVLAALAPRVDARLAASAGVQSTPPSYEAYREFAVALELAASRRGSGLPHLLRAYALDSSYTLPLLYAIMELAVTGRHREADSVIRALLPRRDELAAFDRHQLDYFAALYAGDGAAQLAAARRAHAVAPGSLNAALLVARAAIAVNRPREALAVLEAIDPTKPQDIGLGGYWTQLAGTLHMVGAYERQLEVALAMRRQSPADVRHLFHAARALAALGRHAALDGVLDEGLVLPPVDGWGAQGLQLHVLAHDELVAHGDERRARLVLARAVRHYASAPAELRATPAFQFDLAGAQARLGRLDEARRSYERQLAGFDSTWLFTNRTDLLAKVGHVAALQGDRARAEEVARLLEARRERFTFGQGTEQLAGLHALLGRRETALRLLREAATEGRAVDWNKHLVPELRPLRGWPPFEEWLRPKG